MNLNIRHSVGALWSRPDPLLAEAGLAGERLIAKMRLGVAVVLLFIPVVNAVFFPFDLKEGLIGIGLTSAILLFAVFAYVSVAREYNPPWLGFASSSFDVTVVSGALAIFLLVNQPHTAVNSKVIFEGYFLAISATALRYDKRVCITAGLLAFGEYLAIVTYTANHWDLNSDSFSPYPYGLFGWSAQVSRLILLLIAATISLAIVARGQKLLQLATSDPLTNLFNRASVDDRFTIELSRAHRYNTPLTIAVVDADRFKSLNDSYGHLAGDVILRKIGSILRDSFRLSDTVGRYGGEEFVVILPETDIDTAQRKLESLRELIATAAISLPHGEVIQVTISAGLASFPHDGENAAELFAVADQRMFQAKREGRNRIFAGTSGVLS